MNPAALLALIANLYEQIVVLQEENDRLRSGRAADAAAGSD